MNLPKHQLHHISGVTIKSLNIDRMAKTTINKDRFFNKWKDKFYEVDEFLKEGIDK